MISSAQRRAGASQCHPLLGHARPDAIAAYRHGKPSSAAAFLGHVEQMAAALPPARHVLNFCADRYRFAVLLCAAIARGQMTLLPPAMTANVIQAIRRFAPDVYFVSDDSTLSVDLPQFRLPPESDHSKSASLAVPHIPADQVVACVFTSGSTGDPQPNFKTWGSVVLDAKQEAAHFCIGPGHAVLGTVPPQHMYGFESTIMLPLLSGAALTSERPYFPADIDAAIERVPAPRVLCTTPLHLRAWMAAGEVARIEMVVSATAPLSVPLAREVESRTGATLLEIYGCTEAGQVASRRPTRSPEWELLEGLRLWLDGDRAMVAGGHVEQATVLQDVIEPLGDGSRFLLHGRLADMVNIGGKRNSLGYLNHQLTAIPGVEDGVFFVPGDGDGEGVTRLTAFVVAPRLRAAEVLAALRERIDPAFMPRPLLFVDALPRQLTGKLPREALRDLASRLRKTRVPRGS